MVALKQRLHLIGAGRAGKLLGRMWCQTGQYCIDRVVTRSQATAKEACHFVGQGRPGAIDALPPADIIVVAVSDQALASVAQQLAELGPVNQQIIVHLSGATPVAVFQPLKALGYSIAAAHPARSFANETMTAQDFAGTWVAYEGDHAAHAPVSELFTSIGAQLFDLTTENRPLYHAGTVFASNFLPLIMQSAIRCLRSAGIDDSKAAQILTPLVQGTIENIARIGPANAMTGPITRGDVEVIVKQMETLPSDDIRSLYKTLSLAALELAITGGLDDDQADAVRKALMKSI